MLMFDENIRGQDGLNLLVWNIFLPHHVSIRSVVELSVESIYLQNFVFYSSLL